MASGINVVSDCLAEQIGNYTGNYEVAAGDYFHRLVDEIGKGANSFYGIMDAAKKLEEYKERLDDVDASYIYDGDYTFEKGEQEHRL